MGKRSRLHAHEMSEIRDECAFVEEGCRKRVAYSLMGPFMAPKRLGDVPSLAGPGRIPVVLVVVCEDHVPAALEWMPDPEIMPVDEVPLSALPGLMQYSCGMQLAQVQFTA